MLVASMSTGVEDLIKQASFIWYDLTKTDIEVVTYLNRLQLILQKNGSPSKGRGEEKHLTRKITNTRAAVTMEKIKRSVTIVPKRKARLCMGMRK